jgi:hypothetical protein
VLLFTYAATLHMLQLALHMLQHSTCCNTPHAATLIGIIGIAPLFHDQGQQAYRIPILASLRKVLLWIFVGCMSASSARSVPIGLEDDVCCSRTADLKIKTAASAALHALIYLLSMAALSSTSASGAAPAEPVLYAFRRIPVSLLVSRGWAVTASKRVYLKSVTNLPGTR